MASVEGNAAWSVGSRRRESEGAFMEERRRKDHDGGTDPLAHEPKWPAWKVTVAVVLFCGAFWAGIAYLASRLLG